MLDLIGVIENRLVVHVVVIKVLVVVIKVHVVVVKVTFEAETTVASQSFCKGYLVSWIELFG